MVCLANKITGQFDSIEAAEAAATAIRNYIENIDKITLSTLKVEKDIDSVQLLPYLSKSKRNKFMSQPGYGYPTTSGYNERALKSDCIMTVYAEDVDQVRGRMHNLGGFNIKCEHTEIL